MSTPASQVADLPQSVAANLPADSPVWTTSEAQDEFKFESFLAPFAVVTQKSTGLTGSLQFCSSPRYYFAFVADQS
jgi:hypothetical protein